MKKLEEKIEEIREPRKNKPKSYQKINDILNVKISDFELIIY